MKTKTPRILMRNIFYLFSYIFLFQSCIAIKPTTPESDYDTNTTSIDSLISKINLPIDINVKKIQDELNRLYPIGKRIYSVGHTNQRRRSRISHIRVDVRDKISISTSNGYIKAKIPLVTDIRYEWWRWILGIKYSDKIRFKALETNIYIDIRPKFNQDWSFNPDVRSKVRLNRTGGFLSFLINLHLFSQDGKISEDVKKALLKSINIKSSVKKEYKKLENPILISKEIDSTWMLFKPIKFNFSPPKSIADTLSLNFALSSNVLVKTGVKPNSLNLTQLPPLESEQLYNNSINLLLKYGLDLKTIEKELNKSMIGEYQLTKKRKIKVKKIKVLGLNQNLALKVQFKSGRIYGWLYLLGKLNIDQNQIIYVTDLKFSTDTNKLLLDKAIWLADLIFINKIQKKTKYSIRDKLNVYRTKLNEGLKNITPIENLSISAFIQEMTIKGIHINNQKLIIIPNAKGWLEISYK